MTSSSQEPTDPLVRAAVDAVRTDQADGGGDTLNELAVVAALLERCHEADQVPSLEGEGTATRLRLLDDLRRALLARADASDPEELVSVLGSLERVREELERDWSRRFGLALGRPGGLEIAAEVAHGLRSSCASVLFVAESLRSGIFGELEDIQRDQLGILYRASLTLSAGLSDITELAWRADATGSAGPVEFSVPDVLVWIRDLLAPVAHVKGGEVEVSFPGIGRRAGFPAPLRQILLNLGLHALHRSRGGDVEIRAEDREGSRVDFAVTVDDRLPDPDDPDALRKAFRRRLDDGSWSFSVLGLGLHTARRLARALGSELDAREGEEGIRYAFSLDLPGAGAVPDASNLSERGGESDSPVVEPFM